MNQIKFSPHHNVTGEMHPREQMNFYNDLADSAGHHVLMYAEDSLSQGYLEYFNEKLQMLKASIA